MPNSSTPASRNRATAASSSTSECVTATSPRSPRMRVNRSAAPRRRRLSRLCALLTMPIRHAPTRPIERGRGVCWQRVAPEIASGTVMKIGVLELVALPARSRAESVGRVILTKQFAAIMPQAVTVWCRQLGHRTHYASYYGMGDPFALLPSDLDIVFISCVTHASGLAYALAKLFRRNGALTVIGGPHAKSFPTDCLRFFDL